MKKTALNISFVGSLFSLAASVSDPETDLQPSITLKVTKFAAQLKNPKATAVREYPKSILPATFVKNDITAATIAENTIFPNVSH